MHDIEENKEYDKARTEELAITILRFSNEQVKYELEEVIKEIQKHLPSRLEK